MGKQKNSKSIVLNTQDNFVVKKNIKEMKKTNSYYVEQILYIGLINRASDIHLTYNFEENILHIAYRIDGSLLTLEDITKELFIENLHSFAAEIISRVKILSGMNVTEKRKPQDGRFTFDASKYHNTTKEFMIYDIRVATLPTITGESMTLRILSNHTKIKLLKELGFQDESIHMIRSMLTKQYGLILISGPTGSGKTTTLYTLIDELQTKEKKIISIEDPVERKIPYITQVQINKAIGLDFSNVLRSSLRNDPDIVVISEIRDEETAEIAVRAALTGHLVLATIHTNNTISTVARLAEMGIKKYLLLDALVGVIAQRLIRKVCQFCFGKGCSKCLNGYFDRIVLNEVLMLTDDVKQLFKKHNDFLSVDVSKQLTHTSFYGFVSDIEAKISKRYIQKKDILGIDIY